MFHKLVENDMEYIINHDITWEKLCNSTGLITGANGMIASYLIYTLLLSIPHLRSSSAKYGKC